MAAIRSSTAHAPQQGGVARGSAWVLLAVLALTLAAFASRRVGIDFLLPERMEGDGGVLVRQVELLDEHASAEARAADACWGYYPHVVARVTEACTRASAAVPHADAPLAEHLAAASAAHVRVRSVVVVFAALLAPLTWLLARRFLARGPALVACAFVAVSPLLVVVGQEARPHAPAAALALVAVLAALHLRSAPGWGAYLVAGTAAALALGTLQSGAAVLLPLAAAHLLRERDGRASFARTIGHVCCLALPLALALVFLYPQFGAPASGESATEFGLRDDGNFQFFSHTVFLDQFDGRGFVNLAHVLASFEPLLALLALGGVITWLLARRGVSRDTLVVLAYVVPYTLVIGLYARTYERFVVQLLPYAACAAAYGLGRLAALTPRESGAVQVASRSHTTRRACAALLACAALALPAWVSAATLALRAGPATTDELARRLSELRVTERIACVPFVDLPLARTPEAVADLNSIGWQSPWMGYQRQHAEELPVAPRFDLRTLPLGRRKIREQALASPEKFLRGTGSRLFVVPVLGVRTGDESFRALREALVREGQLLVRCGAPMGVLDETEVPLDAAESSAWRTGNWTWRVLSRDACAGDVVELWRLN